MKASPRGVALYEKSGFRRLKREEFGAFFDSGGEGEAGGEGKEED
jgi:hypothetical protein